MHVELIANYIQNTRSIFPSHLTANKEKAVPINNIALGKPKATLRII